jgi:hypothetical protein
MRKMAFLRGSAGLFVLGAQVSAHAGTLDVGRYLFSSTPEHHLSAALDVMDSVDVFGWPLQVLRLRVTHYLNCPGGSFDYAYTFVLPYNYFYNTGVNGDVVVTNNGKVVVTYNNVRGEWVVTNNASCAMSPWPPTVASFYQLSPSAISVWLDRFSGNYVLTRERGRLQQRAAGRLLD